MHASEGPETAADEVATAAHVFARHSRSPGRARELLRRQLSDWQVEDELADVAVLLISELVTNAVRHGRAPLGRRVGARFTLGDGTLRLEVVDANNDVPQPRSAGDEDEGGRGLTLVAALADQWGTYRRPAGIGKCVWAQLKLPSTRSVRE